MKLTTVTNVSVDGVMQGLGSPDEDRRGGFERGGSALPLFENDNEAATFLNEVYQRRRVSVRPADLRDLRRLLGIMGRSGRQPYLDGIEHEAQVRRIDHAHRTALGEHDRPLR